MKLKVILVIAGLACTALLYNYSKKPHNSNTPVLTVMPGKMSKILYSPGDCVMVFSVFKSFESWEKDENSLQEIYKIKEIGKKSYRVDRLNLTSNTLNWTNDLSVLFSDLDNHDPLLQSVMLDSCDPAVLSKQNVLKPKDTTK